MPHEHKCLDNAITLFLNNNCPKAKMKAKFHEMNVRDLTNTPKVLPNMLLLSLYSSRKF